MSKLYMPKSFRIEADVKKGVKFLLDKHGWFWWMPPANGFGKPNVDFNALRGGVFVCVETKFGNNKPTVNQKAYMNSIQAESGFAFVVTETTLPFLQQWLEAFDRAIGAVSANTGLAPHQAVKVEDGSLMLNAIKAMTDMLAE